MSDLSTHGGFSGAPSKTIARLVAATATLISIATIYGEDIIRALIPILKVVFEWIAGDFKLLSMTVDQSETDRLVKVVVMWKHAVQVGGVVLHPDPRGVATASTLMAHALQGPFVGIIFAIAWPSYMARLPHICLEYIVRIFVLIPLIVPFGCLDLCLMLSGELWQMVYDAFEPGHRSASIVARDFFQNGGRIVAGLLIAAFSTFWGRAIVKKMIRSGATCDLATMRGINTCNTTRQGVFHEQQ